MRYNASYGKHVRFEKAALYYWSLLHSAILCSRADSLRSCHTIMVLNEAVSFHSAFFNIHSSGVLTALFDCCMAGATWNCCRLGARVVYTVQPRTSLQCLVIQSLIGRVHVCLAITCHLHFWQNDWDLLCAISVKLGWNGYWSKRQHRKLTLEKKISRHSCGYLNLRPFDHEPGALQLNYSCAVSTSSLPLTRLYKFTELLRSSPLVITNNKQPNCFPWDSTSWLCTTMLSLVTRGWVLQKIYLPDKAWTHRHMDFVIPIYSLNFVTGGIRNLIIIISVCVCVRVRMLRIVSRDKILRFKNTFMFVAQ